MLVIFAGALGVNKGNKEKNAMAAMNLNLLSREHTPELQHHWVCFFFPLNFCLAVLVANSVWYMCLFHSAVTVLVLELSYLDHQLLNKAYILLYFF